MDRPFFIAQIFQYFRSHSIVALLGPRQCGKTTLARLFIQEKNSIPASNYFDLENPIDRQRLENPMLSLKPLQGLVVIDEIQRFPELFPILRVLVDEPGANRRFLILGSASRDLIRQSSESLAGRIAYLELTPFSFQEVDHIDRLWIRGGFPRSYLAETEEASFDWRESYIRAFLERDIPNLGIRIPPVALRRFWVMLAHYHGNLFNASELGRAFGASDVTMRSYLDLLSGTFMVRQLQPWFSNIGKRQVKSPKIFFRDSGIFHTLLNLHDRNELEMNPKLGASWEGFALEEVIRAHRCRAEDCYFWSTYGEAEIDLLIHQRGGFVAYEFKYSDAPQMTRSLQIALKDLSLPKICVVYPGEKDYPLSDQIMVMGLQNLLATFL